AEIDQLIHLISLWAIDPESIRAQLLHVGPKQPRQKTAETTAEAVDAGIEIGCGIHRHLKIMRRKQGLCGVEGMDTCREKLLIKIILTNFGLTLIEHGERGTHALLDLTEQGGLKLRITLQTQLIDQSHHGWIAHTRRISEMR